MSTILSAPRRLIAGMAGRWLSVGGGVVYFLAMMQRDLTIDDAGGRELPAASAGRGRSRSLWLPRSLFGFVWRPAVRKHLAEAREEIDDLDAFAAEIDAPPPSDVARELAAGLIEKVIPAFPRYYAISPGPDGAVVIQANGAKGYRVGVYCRANGGASMYVNHPQDCIHEVHYRPPATISAEEIVAAMKTLKPRR